MQQAIKQRRNLWVAILLAAIVAAVVVTVITARAQCAPNDLNCMNLP